MLTKKDYQTAIDVQNACNLSGVLHSWAEIISRMTGMSTDERNRHPINVLFADKVTSLTGTDFATAWDTAENETNE